MTQPSNHKSKLPDVDAQQAAAMLDRGEAVLLDVREPKEWSAGHAPQARNIPLGELRPESALADRSVIAVCRSGNRSGKAADLLAAAGVPVHNLAGGMKDWAKAGLPLVTDSGQPGTVV